MHSCLFDVIQIIKKPPNEASEKKEKSVCLQK